MKRLIFDLGRKYYVRLIQPKAVDEEVRRKEFILNVVISIILPLVCFHIAIVVAHSIEEGGAYRGIPLLLMLFIAFMFASLLGLSRAGYSRISAHLLVMIFALSCLYGQLSWGIDLPSVILAWAFIIVISSILISTRYALFLALGISAASLALTYIESLGLYSPIREWKNSNMLMSDVVEYSVLFLSIASISWLSNREIYRSMKRALRSEKELMIERDSLEIKVREKTKELQMAQIEKINQMYRFVEFGRISSGLFHDLMSPLSSLSLNISLLDGSSSKGEKISKDISDQLDALMQSSRKITSFLSDARKQIRQSDQISTFNANEEVLACVRLLQSKARKAGVELVVREYNHVNCVGNSVLFAHVIANLISNAIDSYRLPAAPVDISEHGYSAGEERKVIISIQRKKSDTVVKVKDFGSGIPDSIKHRIFDSFFTTKDTEGCGIGLSATKHIIEHHMKGSNEGNPGTTFTAKIPRIHGQESREGQTRQGAQETPLRNKDETKAITA